MRSVTTPCPASARPFRGLIGLGLALGAALRCVAAEQAVQLSSPVPYAVFQRSAKDTARIPIAGSALAVVDRVEAKVTLQAPYAEGTDGRSCGFIEIARPGSKEFRGTLEVTAGGWYMLTVRTLDKSGKITSETTLPKVGVGEVFVAAGHSFCSNFQGDAPGRAEDDRVATCADWRERPPERPAFRHADDPLRPGDADRASPWPAVGDALVRALHVPVLIVSTGIGGTTVEQWRQGAADPEVPSRAYSACHLTLRHITPYTGLRAIVWFGNENDLPKGPTEEKFSDDLRGLIAGVRADAGNPALPWVIGFDAYDPGVAEKVGTEEKQRRKERIDRGTERVLQTVAHTYDGPQTDDLGPEFRRSDRDHFNEAGVKALGPRFARKITQAFFPPPVPAAQAPRPPAR